MANGIRQEVLWDFKRSEVRTNLQNGNMEAGDEHPANGKRKKNYISIGNDEQRENSEDVIPQISVKYNVPNTSVIPVISCKDDKVRFMVYSDSYDRETHQYFNEHEIIFKNPNVVSLEASDIMKICQSQNIHLTPKERKFMKDIGKYAGKWFSAHSNLNVISTSPVKSRAGEMEMNHPCIVLYCTSKGYIPVGENEFPRTVSMGNQTVDIDVREGHFRFGYNTKASNLRHDTLRMGCEFSKENYQYSGTIGPFVQYEEQLAFLTCAHNIFGIDVYGYDDFSSIFVVQPGWTDETPASDRCGQVRRAAFSPNSPNGSVDAAVVVISDRIPYRGEFAIAREWQYKMAGFDDIPLYNSGRIHEDPSTIDIDQRIVQFGAETHVTRGVLASDGTVVRPLSIELGIHGNPQKVIMGGQMEILGVQPPAVFFQPGDSGAGVFYVDKLIERQELVCIGMAIGCTSYGSGIVTPIGNILNALALPHGSIMSFPERNLK